MKKRIFLLSLLAMFLLGSAAFITSCSDDNSVNSTTNPEVKMIVFSDAHYYDPSLGTSGAAFEKYLFSDRKLIAESDAITQSVIASILASDAQIVIVSGDLTKDGEKQCHQKFAAYLQQLVNAGKKVLVVPGNHDIYNPSSSKYVGDNAVSIENISDSDFRTIYANCGYNSAYAKDSNSLSYAVEPVNGVVYIMMDACKYANKTGEVGGAFNDKTLNWIKTIASAAKANNKTIFGVMHHGILEHFTGQKTNPLSSDYVVDNFATVSQMFAENGIKAVFTGHYHANDVAQQTFGSNTLFDIETGSLVTAPCPYRSVTLTSDNKLVIKTNTVQSINYNLGGKTFPTYAHDVLINGMTALSKYQMVYGYGLDTATASYCAPYLAQTFATHYAGDETISTSMQSFIGSLNAMNTTTSKYFASTITALLTDLAPKDNNLTINLSTGAVTR